MWPLAQVEWLYRAASERSMSASAQPVTDNRSKSLLFPDLLLDSRGGLSILPCPSPRGQVRRPSES
jgi:hypothetical protein